MWCPERSKTNGGFRKLRAPSRGFTYTEFLVSIGIASVMLAGVATIQYVSARMTKDIYGQAHMRGTRMIVFDQIRYHLMNARMGTCTVSQNGRRIDYTDPTISGAPNSALYFVPSSKTLYYDANTNDSTAAVVVSTGAVDVTFTVAGAALVSLAVKSSSDVGFGAVDTEAATTSVYLRNP